MNSTPLTDQPILAYGIALGIGLLIGAERERRKGIGPTRSSMGIRTFSTTSLLGAVSLTLGGSTLLAVMALAVAGLTAMALRLSDAPTRFGVRTGRHPDHIADRTNLPSPFRQHNPE